MTDKDLMIAALTVDDRLDDVGRARIWSRIEDRIAEPAPSRRWWPIALPLAACAAAAAALVLRAPAAPEGRVLSAADDVTLVTHLGPHTRASLVGPARLRVIGEPGDVTTVRLERGTLLADFSGGPGRALHVDAPGMTIDVVGTLFAVEVGKRGSCLSVAHGRVAIVIGGAREVVATGQRRCTSDAAAGAITATVEDELARHAALVAEAAPMPEIAPPARAVETAPTEPEVTPTAPEVTPTAPEIAPTAPPAAPATAPEIAPTAPARAPLHVPPPPAPAEMTASTSATDEPPPLTRIDTSLPTVPPPDAAPPPAPAPPPAQPKPPTAEELYRNAEAALARRDPDAADHALEQLVAAEPSSPLVGQALYERARIAYQRRAWAAARHHLDALASVNDPSLAEAGRYMTCRIAVEVHDGEAAACLAEFRRAFPQSAHDRDVLATLAQLAFAGGGCTAARGSIAELAWRYAQSPLAKAWRDKCPAK